MGKLRSLVIQLDNSTSVYRPNQMISGHVEFVLDEPMKIKCIRLKLYGYGKVYWREPSGRVRLSHVGKEVYMNDKMILSETEASHDTFPAGLHRYPFSLLLPANIPASFESGLGDDAFGRVCYVIESVIEKLRLSNSTTRAIISVVRDLDLNTEPAELREPFQLTNNSEVQRWWCCSCGSVLVSVSLNKRCFVPGEQILISAEIHNNSRTEIKGTRAALKQITEWIAPDSSRTQCPIEWRVEKREKIPVGGSYVWNEVPLVVPSVPSSRLDGCRIININYVLSFRVNMSCNNIEQDIPVVIGTVPLREECLPPHRATTDAVLPTYEESIVLPTYEDSVNASSLMTKEKDGRKSPEDLLSAS